MPVLCYNSLSNRAARVSKRSRIPRLALNIFRNDIGRAIWLPGQHTIRLGVARKGQSLRIECELPAKPIADIGEVSQVGRKNSDFHVGIQLLIIAAAHSLQ